MGIPRVFLPPLASNQLNYVTFLISYKLALGICAEQVNIYAHPSR